MLGLPRWLFRDAMMNACSYTRSICRRNPSETFFYELRLRRFLMLFLQASLHGFGIKTPTVQSRAQQAVLKAAHGLEAQDSNLSDRVWSTLLAIFHRS